MDYFDSLYPFKVFVGVGVLWQSSWLCQSLRRFLRADYLVKLTPENRCYASQTLAILTGLPKSYSNPRSF
jgi:hypothetical protein